MMSTIEEFEDRNVGWQLVLENSLEQRVNISYAVPKELQEKIGAFVDEWLGKHKRTQSGV